MDQQALLKATALSKAYKLNRKSIDILMDAELHVAPGETVAIIGRSGAGKSTLLHVLGGLDKADAGDVIIEGCSLLRASRRMKTKLRAERIGFVFQAYHLLPEMDIVENVMLPAMATHRLSRAAMRQRAVDLLTQVGLEHRLTHHPQELSGGEQQRAAIARALMNEPRLILADEPTGNLDAMTGEQVLDLLFSLVKESQAALVMVTHSPETAQRCQSVYHLEGGKLYRRAPLSSLLED